MSGSSNEVTKNPEYITQEVFYNLLNGVGNHEAKLLVTAIMAIQPEKWFSLTILKNELRDRQGPKPAWVQEARSTFSYCEDSLAPIGAVIKGRISGRLGEIDAYKASDIGQKLGLALAGELLEWSLRYPECSLQQVLGSTHSTGTIRSPQTRFHIYEAMLTQLGESPSIKDINTALSDTYTRQQLHKHIKYLHDDVKILNVMSPDQEGYNPVIEINPENRKKQRDYPRPEAQAIQKAINNLVDEGVSQTTYVELLNKVVSDAKDLDPIEIRTILTKGLTKSARNFPEIRYTDRAGIIIDRSVVSINPNVRLAIEDLVSRLETIGSTANIADSATRAKEIVSDPEKVRELMQKAQKYSSAYIGIAEGGGLDLSERIHRVVSSLGSLTRDEIRKQLEDEGRNISVERASQVIRSLVAEGMLQETLVQVDESKRRKLKKYSAIDAALAGD